MPKHFAVSRFIISLQKNYNYMKINNLSEHNCIINRYLAEMRDCDYQKNRLLFRNIMRIGEYEALKYQRLLITKRLSDYTARCGPGQSSYRKIVIGTIFVPDFAHEGFSQYFRPLWQCLCGAYRKYTNKNILRWAYISNTSPHLILQIRCSSLPTLCLHRYQHGDG